MNPLFSAAAEVQELCLERAWRFCFIGGLAVVRWGEPRLTRDIDLTILAGFGEEETVISGLLDRLAPRLHDAREFGVQHRVVLLRAANGIPVDVALGAFDFEKRVIQRASPWNVGGVELLTCSAEDLIVHKVFAGRDRDWADVAGIVTRRRGLLDRGMILADLLPLLEAKGSGADLDRLQRTLDAQR